MATRPSPAQQRAILCDGCDHVETAAELEARIAAKDRLTVKFGVDPTGSYLHLGHAVVLHKMQQFVELGHRVILLIGDFTARIGDPTGRKEARPRLDDAEIANNMADYKAQAGKVLDLERIEMMYNSTWLAKLKLGDFVELAAQTTVAQLLARAEFAERYQTGVPIALHEFVYPIAVAYDSVVMEADVELGGSDQLFNLLIGRDYQDYFKQPKQICMTTPILEGTDGVIRMGKSRGNYIGLSEPPEDQFGKLMSIPDAMIPRYAQLAAFRPAPEVFNLRAGLESGALHPMAAKKDLAEEIVARYQGKEAAARARERFEATVQRGELPSSMAELEAGDWKTVGDALLAAGFASSRREAERLAAGGGVKLDGVAVQDARRPWAAAEPVVLSAGNRRFVRILPRRS
jgi:tyrosyl-tRNA synthetase